MSWASTAPQYKKDGKMYSSVEYDQNGDPKRIRVGQNQTRRGEFDVEGDVAVYDPHGLPTLPEAGSEVVKYVRSLSFVETVDMSSL